MMRLPMREKSSRAYGEELADGRAISHRNRSRAGIAGIIAAAFVGPWAVWSSAIAQDQGWITWRLPQGVALWSLTPALIIALLVTGGRAAIADLARRVLPHRGTRRYLAVALATPLLLAAAAAGGAALLGAPAQIGVILDLPSAARYLVYGVGLFLLTEEAVWRGTLLPRLQARLTPLAANLVLGGIWAVWHLPLLAVPGAGDEGLPVLPFLVLVAGTGLLIAALTNAARGSVLVAATFHAAFDAAYSYLGVIGSGHTSLWTAAGITTVAAVAVTICTRGRLGLPAGRR